MAQDEEFETELPPARGRPGGRLFVAGVVGACVLGAGLGLWARPAAHERQVPEVAKPEPKPEPLPARILEIVIDDTPAPIGAPMDVMPVGVAPGIAPTPQPAPQLAPAQPLAPRPSPTGLMKVDTPPVTIDPPPVVKPVLKVAEAPLAPPRAVEKPPLKPKAEVVVARKPAKEIARPTKAAKSAVRTPEKVKVAKVERPKPVKAEPAKKKPGGLVRLARAVKAAPAKVERKIEKQIAKAEPPKEGRKARLARLKAEARKAQLAKAQAKKLQLAKAEARKPKKTRPEPRGTGPMRVAKASRCASVDPGEAAVCADPRLASRERQMQVAYRNAEAAGVPASSLRRQQARWVQARAAAAREAPWAVEDVYQARIAELNDLARDANGPY